MNCRPLKERGFSLLAFVGKIVSIAPMPTDKAILVSIRGRVQGVGFRMWTEHQARALGLRGWVRNEPDGSVTALLGGPDDAVAKMLELFWRGPRGAKVTSVTTQPADTTDLPQGFREIR
jgi:acylphosphatase